MDAMKGDQILFRANNLHNVKLILGLGKGFTLKDLKSHTFLFTEAVNANGGGYVKFPYGYNGYLVIEFDQKRAKQTDGQWDFDVRFIRNDTTREAKEPLKSTISTAAAQDIVKIWCF